MYLVCMAALGMSFCSGPTTVEGGGTRGGNPVVIGSIVDTDGKALSAVVVSLIASDFNPVTGASPEVSLTDTTDSLGTFEIETEDSGQFTVEAVGLHSGARSIHFNVEAIADSTVELPVDTLRDPGAISLVVPGGSDSAPGYVYVPGSSISATFSGTHDTIRIDSVPAGILPELHYVGEGSDGESIVSITLSVESGETTLVVAPQWRYSRRIVLNTSSSGAGVENSIADFPVLIRLYNTDFDFSQAADDGSDCMFTGTGNSRLRHEIERWDAVAGKAEIWVMVDTVFGDNSTQSIMMYWGALEGEGTLVSGSVFRTDNGFQGVWHLGEQLADATENDFDGESPDTATPQVAEGVIGNCRLFDGVDDFITMPNTAEGKLDLPEDGIYTVYAWVLLDTLDVASHCIVSKGYEQYYLRSTYIEPSMTLSKPLWEFVEFSETDKWQASNSAATVKEWSLLVGVRQGNRQRLYCNGVLVDSTMDTWRNEVSRNTANNLMIGRFARPVTVPIIEGYCHFRGGIDEVRIISAARTADWVRLCYMNQRADNRLVEFK